jgi:hypothetical protein
LGEAVVLGGPLLRGLVLGVGGWWKGGEGRVGVLG